MSAYRTSVIGIFTGASTLCGRIVWVCRLVLQGQAFEQVTLLICWSSANRIVAVFTGGFRGWFFKEHKHQVGPTVFMLSPLPLYIQLDPLVQCFPNCVPRTPGVP